MARRIASLLTVLALVAGCQGSPAASTRAKAKASPAARSSATPAPVLTAPAVTPTGTPPVALPSSLTGTGLIANDGSGIVSNNSGALVGNNGAGVVSDHGGGITGTVRALSALLPAGGYRLVATAPAERGVGGVLVALLTADGQQVKDTNGKAVTATTAADGSYTLKFGGNTHNLVVSATLPAGKGAVVGFVPKGVGDQAVGVNLDTASTLELQYILAKYVLVQSQPTAVLDKLPASVEADTHAKVAQAIADVAPTVQSLTPQAATEGLEQLRDASTTVNGQLEVVRALLFAGLSNQGVGLPVTDVELDPTGLALAPGGELYFCEPTAGRIFKKSLDGHLVVFAGNGKTFETGTQEDQARGQGDGGPALDAVFGPRDLAFDAAGTCYVLEPSHFRIRKIGTDGIATTYAAFKAGSELTALAVAPDGTVYAALAHGVYKLTGGTPALIAGEDQQGALLQEVGTASGDGGPPLAARFASVTGLACDPATGEPVAFDHGAIRRIGKDVVTAIAGSSTQNGHQDGPGAGALFGSYGALAFRSDGTLVVADTTQNYLRAVAGDGTASTLAGSGHLGLEKDGTDLATVIGVPLDVAVAPDGAVYLVTNGIVRSLVNGTLGTIAGMIQASSTPRTPLQVQFETPKWLRYDADADAMYVADTRHVWRWDLAANLLSVFGSAAVLGLPYHDGDPLDTAALIAPSGIELAADGALVYMAKVIEDGSLRMFRQVGTGGTSLLKGIKGGPEELDAGVVATGGPLYGPAIASAGGSRYYTIPGTYHIRRVEADGSTTPFAGYGTSQADGTPAHDFKFTLPNVLERGPDGALYVGAINSVYRIDPATTQVTAVLGKGDDTLSAMPRTGDQATQAPTALITGITWDAQGRLLASDLFKHVVMRREADGTITLLAGKGSANFNADDIDEGLGGPAGLAFDKRGNLFIADAGAGQVKRVAAADLPR